jgi:Flp pilus assembly protein TadD
LDAPTRAPWLVALLGAALYLPTLAFGYVNLDDPWLIRDNALLHGLSSEALRAAWTDLSWATRFRLGGEFLPVRDTSVMLDHSLWGGWVGGQHLTNLLLYALVCGGLCAVVGRWARDWTLALWAGVFFALHPIHAEAGAWLSERKGLLAALFWVGAALLLEQFRGERGRAWHLALALVCVPLAIFSKAMAVAGVGALAALVWCFPREGRRLPSPREWGALGALALASAAAFWPGWATGQQLGMVQQPHGGGLLGTALIMAEVHERYWALLCLVEPWAVRYPLDPAAPVGWRVALGALLALALLALALLALGWPLWARWRAGKNTGGVGDAVPHLLSPPSNQPPRWLGVLGFAAGWWWVWVSPVSQFLFPLQNLMADRYMLLPSLSWALGAAWLLKPREGAASARALTVGRWGLAVLLGALASAQIQTWRSTETLYTRAVEVAPRWPEAWNALSHDAAEQGRAQDAWGYTVEGLRHVPGDPTLLHRQALLLREAGREPEAEQKMREAAASPLEDRAKANLALMLLKRGAKDEALGWAQRAVQIRPKVAHNQRTLGRVALELGRLDEALGAFQQAAALEPNVAGNHLNLGLCLLRMGQRDEARAALERARTLDPRLAEQVEKMLE